MTVLLRSAKCGAEFGTITWYCPECEARFGVPIETRVLVGDGDISDRKWKKWDVFWDDHFSCTPQTTTPEEP